MDRRGRTRIKTAGGIMWLGYIKKTLLIGAKQQPGRITVPGRLFEPLFNG
jgi:hypothetical protein